MTALPVTHQEIREAMRALIRAYGGQDAVGERFGVDQRRVSDMLHSDRMLPLPWIAQMEAATRGLPGHPHVTNALARNVDRLTVERPTAEATVCSVPGAVMRISAELGDLSRCVSDMLADGEADAAEIAGVVEELNHLDQASATLRQQLIALETALTPAARRRKPAARRGRGV